MSTDTSEWGLESLIIADMMEDGWIASSSKDYLREHAVDLLQLTEFIKATQPTLVEPLGLDKAGSLQRGFLDRLQSEISKRGVSAVLREGIKHKQYNVNLFYATPSEGNQTAKDLYAKNRFSVTRQLHYSKEQTRRALDLCIFINGLPIATFELKNTLTGQTVQNAIDQYKKDRDPKERLFEHGRCIAHFAVDDNEVAFCSHLQGNKSWFLPFNKGYNDGAGNPPNPEGIKTDYLWKQVLTPSSLTNIIENYAYYIKSKDPKTGKKLPPKQIFPRYHQLDATRKLLQDAREVGAGKRYLVQHSAGSGKSNSIAWLTHQLVGLKKDDKYVFDSILVVTDRIILDDQLTNTIKQFVQVPSTVVHADKSTDLKDALTNNKKIIVTTVQKFPFILEGIGSTHKNNRFAVIIDEAHSGQGGKAASAINSALGTTDNDADEIQDKINELMQSRKMPKNASFYAFTATPKTKTLEMFGTLSPNGVDTKFKPFHSYTMKQAIQEGFILDVLKNYVPVSSYYKIVQSIQDDPEFEKGKANKALKRYAEGNPHAIKQKADIMVEAILNQTIRAGKINGQARAMIVVDGISRAIDYYFAVVQALKDNNSIYKPIVAFSGEVDYNGKKVTEASINGFASKEIIQKIKQDPYRILVCADKLQTGYDEPLLHTMCVDKKLNGIKAVQTLSRLNRAYPNKVDTLVIDFVNRPNDIKESFDPYYRGTILSQETDPNRLHDLQDELDELGVYTEEQTKDFFDKFIDGADRSKLDPILDICVEEYKGLGEDDQATFKGNAKLFVRAYEFLSAILPYSSEEWEYLSTFLTFLIKKLPTPDNYKSQPDIIENVSLENYRAEKKQAISIILDDDEGILNPTIAGKSSVHDPENEFLSIILDQFNELFGGIEFEDNDHVAKFLSHDLPKKIENDEVYQNAKENNDKETARIEHGHAIERAMGSLMKDNSKIYAEYHDNKDFRDWVRTQMFNNSYKDK